jgi:hypothetical protein
MQGMRHREHLIGGQLEGREMVRGVDYSHGSP